jgi:hypothetical protein
MGNDISRVLCVPGGEDGVILNGWAALRLEGAVVIFWVICRAKSKLVHLNSGR